MLTNYILRFQIVIKLITTKLDIKIVPTAHTSEVVSFVKDKKALSYKTLGL